MTGDFSYFPKPGYTFWLYDPEGDGLTFYRTAKNRDAAAADAIDEYKADGEWSDEVEGLCAGIVTHTAQCKDKVMRPPAEQLEDGDYDPESGVSWRGFEWMGNYTLEPIEVGS